MFLWEHCVSHLIQRSGGLLTSAKTHLKTSNSCASTSTLDSSSSLVRNTQSTSWRPRKRAQGSWAKYSWERGLEFCSRARILLSWSLCFHYFIKQKSPRVLQTDLNMCYSMTRSQFNKQLVPTYVYSEANSICWNVFAKEFCLQSDGHKTQKPAFSPHWFQWKGLLRAAYTNSYSSNT